MPIQMLEVQIEKLLLTCPPLRSVAIESGMVMHPELSRAIKPHPMVRTDVKIDSENLIDFRQVKVGDAVVIRYPNRPPLCSARVASLSLPSNRSVVIGAISRTDPGYYQNKFQLKLPIPQGFSARFADDKTEVELEYFSFEISLQDYWIGRDVSLSIPPTKGLPAKQFEGYITSIHAIIHKTDLDRLRLTLVER